jgi:hypothetical protein
MEKQVVIIKAEREGYSVEQVRRTMTVSELIDALQQYDEDAQVYLSHDNGYTYGGISWCSISDDYVEQDEEEEA